MKGYDEIPRLPSWPCRFDPGHPLHALTSSYARLLSSNGFDAAPVP